MQKSLSFYHVICPIWFQIWYSMKKIVWKMQYKPIKNYHVENVVLRKDFNLGVIGSLFQAFTLGGIENLDTTIRWEYTNASSESSSRW
jgi:hypothetical protein